LVIRLKTRIVEKHLYKNYLKKAEEFINACNDSFLKEDWDAVVINAVHSGISASDALTIFFKGVRHAGERHEDVIQLLNTLELHDINDKNRHVMNLLSVKNKAEYEETLMTRKNAEDAKRSAERFLNYVKGTLKT